MSPFFVLPGVTPQSIRIWCGPSSVGTVMRKKSPKPTRYIRIRSSPFFALLFVVAISDASVQHIEVDLEAVSFALAIEAEVLTHAPLALLALGAKVLRDHVTNRRLVFVCVQLTDHGLADDECSATPKLDLPELRRRRVEILFNRLHRLNHHVCTQAPIGIDAEYRVEGGDDH